MLDDLVRGYAVADFETARSFGHLVTVRSELAVFNRALVVSDNLRFALTDAALTPVVRRGIVADLLVDRATKETSDLVGFIVRVVRAPDVPATVAEVLGLSLDAPDNEHQLIDANAPSGRTGARERIRGYTERTLQELDKSSAIDEVQNELFSFARLLDENPQLRRVLEDVNFPLEARVAVLSDLLAARAQPATLRLACFVLRAGRLRNLVGTFDWLVELAAEERGRRVAEVRTAVPLEEAEIARLASSLRRLVGREVEVRVISDPTVIGGMLIATGDLFIDGTVRLRFERLRDVFAQQA